MLDLTTIILTYNERRHIERCLENVLPFSKRVIVVDSCSADGTQEIARRMGAEVVEHAWPGNQALQFNWALDNLSIDTEWILRLDADEYLTPELIQELEEKLPSMPEDVSCISLKLGRAFNGRMLKHGITGGVKIVRLFRTGQARYENRLMDEHLVILQGRTVEMKHKFVDDSRIPIGQFIDKHNAYASREAALMLDAEFGIIGSPTKDAEGHSQDVDKKRRQKGRYARMPLQWRAFGYFIYRYIFRLGFLDGRDGFLWDFMQGWWYRALVDAKIAEVKRVCGSDPEKIREYLRDVYGVKL